MWRVVDVYPDRVHAEEGSALVGPPPEGVLRWIDLAAQDDAQLALLKERFGFHPLAIEDCAHFDQRPKMEEYGSYLFIVTHGLRLELSDPPALEIAELHAFLGKNYLVTVHTEPLAAIEEIRARVLDDESLRTRGADFIYYLVQDAIVDGNFPLLDQIADELETMEMLVLERSRPSHLARMFQLKRILVTMRKTLAPQRDTCALLVKRSGEFISDRTALYFRDIYDHLVRITESLEMSRDLLSACFEAYLSMVSQRTNEIMKSLTIMSAIFLPLTFIVGFFGQNFGDFPGIPDWVQSNHLMWTMIALCATTPLVMLLWFRARRWL